LFKDRRACESGPRTVRVRTEAREFISRMSEDIRSLGLVNDTLMIDYMPRCRCGVQEDRQPNDGLSRRVFESFLTARIGVSDGRFPQEAMLEEFYRSECSETVQVGRLRVFQEFPTVFNCSVLTFGVQ
jgi:hypothetical protein